MIIINIIYCSFIYFFFSLAIIAIVVLSQVNLIHTSDSGITYYRKTYKLYKNKLNTKILLNHADSKIITSLKTDKVKRNINRKYLIIPEYNHKFIILSSHKGENSKNYRRLIFNLQNTSFSTEPFSIYKSIQIFQNITNPVYKLKYKNSFASMYHVTDPMNKVLFSNNFPIFTYGSLYLSGNDSLKYLIYIHKCLSKDINNLSKNETFYRETYEHKRKDNVAKYINLSNFQIFIYLGIDLMIISLFSIVMIYMLFMFGIFVKSKNYLCNLKTFFINFLIKILDEYIYKIIPLLIAIMSGILVVYFKGVTPNIFKLLIIYAIPSFSSIQFLRISISMFNELYTIYSKYDFTVWVDKYIKK